MTCAHLSLVLYYLGAGAFPSSPPQRTVSMKIRSLQALVAGLILSPCILLAQAPAGAPAGTTGKCKDGTFTSAPKKQGACRGHKGIDTWYAADATPAAASAPSASSTAAPAAKSSSSPAPAASPAPSSSSTKSTGPKTPRTAAPGGAPGLVWVNSSTNVYHCYGTQFYGTTKAGKYMSEAEAKAAGARPDRNKACSAK